MSFGDTGFREETKEYVQSSRSPGKVDLGEGKAFLSISAAVGASEEHPVNYKDGTQLCETYKEGTQL